MGPNKLLWFSGSVGVAGRPMTELGDRGIRGTVNENQRSKLVKWVVTY